MKRVASPSRPITIPSSGSPSRPKTTVYVSTVAGISHKTIYVVFALKPETVGKVTMVMTLGGVNVADPLTIDYQTKNSWGDFKINFPSSGMPVGDYQATMTYEPTGAAVTVLFTVT